MANRTIKEAISVKGTNPQYLVEKIIRTRIYDSKYWKEECFALTAELMVDKAMELRYIGGIFGGNVKPTPFLSLTLKMLQIQPEKDIVVEFIKNEDFKYVRALGAFYMRLVGTSVEIYKYLEPLYNDYRKIRFQNKEGNFELLYMDDFIDSLLREERFCDVILPRLQKRQILEEANEVEPRVSALEEDLEEEDSESEEEEGERKGGSLSPPPTTSRSKQDSDRERERSRRNRDKERERERSRERRDRHRDRSRSREKRNRSRERDRDRSRERDRSRRQRSRSVERSRDYRRDQDRDRRDRKDRGKDRESERDRSKRGEDRDKYNNKKKDSKKSSSSSAAIDPEIAEANALRAKLGLAPLRP